MFDWQALINWLNRNSGSVMAALTAAYVVCTVVLCIFSWRSNRLTRHLYEAENRPVVICDFFSQNTCLYFRVKNIGRTTATDVRLEPMGPIPQLVRDWKDHPLVANGIAFLPPGAERVFFYCGPGHEDLLRTVQCTVRYADGDGRRRFEDRQDHNLETWLREDLGRESNSPLIRELKKIAMILEKK